MKVTSNKDCSVAGSEGIAVVVTINRVPGRRRRKLGVGM
jgi:hypothetical protein